MLGQQLVRHLAKLMDRHAAHNPMFSRASAGRLTRDQIAHYIYNTAFIGLNTHIHVELGLYRAQATQQTELAKFFAEKKLEEEGHAKWAVSDLQQLGCEPDRVREFAVQAPLRELFSYVQHELDRNPASYLVYSLFAEYVNLRMIPPFVEALVRHCGISRGALSMFIHHGELDPDHVEEDLRMIDLINAKGGGLSLEPACQMLSCLDRYFFDFSTAIAEHAFGERENAG